MANELDLKIYKSYICAKFQDDWIIFALVIVRQPKHNHKILLDKLHSYGIRGKAFSLLENYLTHRGQSVRIGDNTSEQLMVNTGVP